MSEIIEATIVEKTCWTPDLYSLRFAADLGSFQAGQFIRIALDVEGERLMRPYSLVNAPADATQEIYFNTVPEGPVTPRLCELEVGDRLQVEARPRGVLTLQGLPQSRNLWMFATGTGLGPFLSILATQEPWSRYESVVLVHSVRLAAELSYQARIQQISQQQGAQFHYVPVVTREKISGTLQQRIPVLIANGSLEQLSATVLEAEHSHVLLCGNQDMIADVHTELEKRHMQRHTRARPGHISSEKYH